MEIEGWLTPGPGALRAKDEPGVRNNHAQKAKQNEAPPFGFGDKEPKKGFNPIVIHQGNFAEENENQMRIVPERIQLFLRTVRQDVRQFKSRLVQEKRKQGWLGNFWDGLKGSFGTTSEGKGWYNPLRWWSNIVSYDTSSKGVQHQADCQEQDLDNFEKCAQQGHIQGMAHLFEKLTGKPFSEENLAQVIANPSERLEKNGLSEKLKAYQESQSMGVDCLSDVLAGVGSGFIVSGLCMAGVAAIPFTAGASLGLVAAAIGFGAASGAALKVALKASNAYSAEDKQNYTSLKSDLITGGVVGGLSPIINGVGGFVAKRMAGTAWMQNAGVKLLAEETKQGVVTRVVTTNATRKAKLILMGTRSVVEGGTFGTVDTPIRTALHGGSVSDVLWSIPQGFAMGATGDFVMRGGFKVVSKSAAFTSKKLFNIGNKVKPPGSSPTTPTPSFAGELDYLLKPLNQGADRAQEILASMLSQAEKNPKLARAIQKRLPELFAMMKDPSMRQGDPKQKSLELLKLFKISGGKVQQILCEDEAVHRWIRETMVKAKSGYVATRTLDQAQRFADKVYGKGKYQVQQFVKAGTVGETWLAVANETQERVILKALKKGVNTTILNEEKLMIQAYIKAAFKKTDPQFKRACAEVRSLFKSWARELNFKHEFKAGLDLSKGAKRYKVAKPKELGVNPKKPKQGISLILEFAPGLMLEDLEKMVLAYRKNPKAFMTQYAKEIEKFPWLKDINVWMKDLPDAYLRALNEQSLLLRPGQKLRVTHGDPHSGNIFMTWDPKAKQLVPVMIDTGLVLTRNAKQVAQHQRYLAAFLMGDTEAIAHQLVTRAKYCPKNYQGTVLTQQEMISRVSKELKDRLYRSGEDFRDVRTVKRITQEILDEFGIVACQKDATFLKAQKQVADTYRSLSNSSGQSGNNILQASMPDISKGLIYMLFHRPQDVAKFGYQCFKSFLRNPTEAWTVLMHFMEPKPLSFQVVLPAPMGTRFSQSVVYGR